MFNVPPTTRSYGDKTPVYSLIRKTGEATDRACDLWKNSRARYPLHYRPMASFLTVFPSYQDDVWMIMKGWVQWNSVYG